MVISRDSRWGMPMKATAEGSSTDLVFIRATAMSALFAALTAAVISWIIHSPVARIMVVTGKIGFTSIGRPEYFAD